MIKFVLPRGILKVVVSLKIKKRSALKNILILFSHETPLGVLNNFLYFQLIIFLPLMPLKIYR